MNRIWSILCDFFDKVCIFIYKVSCILTILMMFIAMLLTIYIVIAFIIDYIPVRWLTVLLIIVLIPIISIMFIFEIMLFIRYMNKISLRYNYKPFLIIVFDKIKENLVPFVCVSVLCLISICLALINSFGYNSDDFVLVIMAVLVNALYSFFTRNTKNYEKNKLMIDNIRDIFLVGIIGYWLIDKYKDVLFLKEISWLLNGNVNIIANISGVLFFTLISMLIAIIPLAVFKSFTEK